MAITDSITSGINTITSSLSTLVNLIFRSVLLGGLIFLATTYIPKTELSLQSRLMISAIVVVVYSLLDIFSSGLTALKDQSCSLICGCSGSATTAPKLTL